MAGQNTAPGRKRPPVKGKPATGPSRSSGTGAYELLLARIENGDLPAGTRLREAELAQRFSLSRTPIREAMKRLEQQGLITHEPHHGGVVTSLNYNQIAELYLLREVLEGTAARLAAQHASDVEITLLQEMLEQDQTLTSTPTELAKTNRAFHQQIRDAGRNGFLAQALETLRLSLALLPGTTLGAPSRGAASVREHAQIVERIAARDPDGAEQAARQHIRNAFKTRIQLLQKRLPS
ncbi:GntR family transcriptional regulator [Acidocella sp.]|uniref:GntR family transcriptional regulator n=1 Tax=Acidocella sp. TaxID=50710 RepID=UPI003CFC8322